MGQSRLHNKRYQCTIIFFRCAYHFYPSRTKDFLSWKSQSILHGWYRTASEYVLNANIRGYECCSLYIIVKWLSEPLCNSQCGNLFSPPNLINDPVLLWPFWLMVSINHSFASSPRLWKTWLHSQSAQWDKHGMNGSGVSDMVFTLFVPTARIMMLQLQIASIRMHRNTLNITMTLTEKQRQQLRKKIINREF